MIDEELTAIMDELDSRIRLIRGAVQRLSDKLHALATPTPTLPDKPGFYLTQQHTVLRRHHDGEWQTFDNSGSLKRVYWKGQGLCSELGPDAFPLVPISEVILHTKEETK